MCMQHAWLFWQCSSYKVSCGKFPFTSSPKKMRLVNIDDDDNGSNKANIYVAFVTFQVLS